MPSQGSFTRESNFVLVSAFFKKKKINVLKKTQEPNAKSASEIGRVNKPLESKLRVERSSGLQSGKLPYRVVIFGWPIIGKKKKLIIKIRNFLFGRFFEKKSPKVGPKIKTNANLEKIIKK